MEFLSQNPKKRKMVFIAVVIGAMIIGGGFFFMKYGMPGVSSGIPQAVSVAGGKVSEGSLKMIEGNISALREELNNNFYKSLKQYKTVPDTAPPGKQNPFAE